MKNLDVSLGEIEYVDTGGNGPTVVLLHGLLMNSTLWEKVAHELGGVRCIIPTLPMGAHRLPVGPDADVSLDGIAALVLELLDHLDLHDVTLVGNDTGGAVAQMAVRRDARRIGRLVLVSCEAFDNFPPGLTGRTIVAAGRLSPPLFGLFMQQLRLRPLRRMPMSFGWLTKRGDEVVRNWLHPTLGDKAIRRNTVRLLRSIRADGPAIAASSEALARFDKPALVVWAAEDRVMPPDHGRRLADMLPQGKLLEVADSYTLVPLDQPAELAAILRDFATH